MPRRGNIAKRDVLADPIYNSKMVTRLVNSVMLDGKKGVAQKIVYEAFSMIQEKTGNDPLETFEKAMENIMPSLECKTRRVGGANYQVPLEVSPARRETLGLRWLTAYSRSPLIVVNCIILGRAEAFAAKNSPVASLFDGIGIGLGFTIGLTLLGVCRELLGSGSVFGLQLLPETYNILLFVLPPGAFITLGFLVAIVNKLKKA